MPWNTLRIDPTRDARTVRQAYARALKTREHEGNADYFEKLRAAYEQALAICAAGGTADEASPPQDSRATTGRGEPAHRPDLQDDEPANAATEREQTGFSPVPPELFESLNRALARLADSLRPDAGEEMATAWRNLAAHPLLQRLDIRERVSEVVADMIATRWPDSSPVWALAEKEFAWEPPTQSDRGALFVPLRWIYERLQSENARWDRLWETYRTVSPHPNELLSWKGHGWRKAVRFMADRNARCVMRRFIADVSALGLDDQFGDRTPALNWWKSAFSRPLPTRRHLTPALLSLTGIPAARSDPYYWKVMLLFIGVSVFWYATAVAWNRFHVGARLNKRLDGPCLQFGPIVLLAAGVAACGLALPTDSAVLTVVGVTSTTLSALWAWMRSADASPFKFMDDARLLRFIFFYLLLSAGFAEFLRLPPTDLPEFPLRYAFGLSVAHWVLYSGGQMLGALESRFRALAELRIERGMVVATPILLVAQVATMAVYPSLRPFIDALSVILIVICWSAVAWRNWRVNWGNLAVFAFAWFALTIVFKAIGVAGTPGAIGPILCVAMVISAMHIWRSSRVR